MQFPRLSDAEYTQLALDAPDTDTYWFQAIDPTALFTEEWDQPERKGMTVQYLNVAVPHQYRTPQGYLLVILPIGDPTTYDMLNAIWPMPDEPFAFVIRENLYDDMDETGFYFRDGLDEEDGKRRLPAFNMSDWRTH